MRVLGIAPPGGPARERGAGAAVDVPLGGGFVAHFDGSLRKTDDVTVGGYVLAPVLRVEQLAIAAEEEAEGHLEEAEEARGLASLRGRERTAGNARLTLVVALNYGSRSELCAATRRIAGRVAAGEVDPAAIDEAMIGAELQTDDLPDLDLLIRTSGEIRLSNFLLWQAAYAELSFTPVLWPDFDADALRGALDDFAARQRRFGGR